MKIKERQFEENISRSQDQVGVARRIVNRLSGLERIYQEQEAKETTSTEKALGRR